jgi:hypothetical protein
MEDGEFPPRDVLAAAFRREFMGTGASTWDSLPDVMKKHWRQGAEAVVELIREHRRHQDLRQASREVLALGDGALEPENAPKAPGVSDESYVR